MPAGAADDDTRPFDLAALHAALPIRHTGGPPPALTVAQPSARRMQVTDRARGYASEPTWARTSERTVHRPHHESRPRFGPAVTPSPLPPAPRALPPVVSGPLPPAPRSRQSPPIGVGVAAPGIQFVGRPLPFDDGPVAVEGRARRAASGRGGRARTVTATVLLSAVVLWAAAVVLGALR